MTAQEALKILQTIKLGAALTTLKMTLNPSINNSPVFIPPRKFVDGDGRVRVDDGACVCVVLSAVVPDRDDPTLLMGEEGRPPLTMHDHLAGGELYRMTRPREVLEWVRGKFREFINHEIDEGLSSLGLRPFDPHGLEEVPLAEWERRYAAQQPQRPGWPVYRPEPNPWLDLASQLRYYSDKVDNARLRSIPPYMLKGLLK